MSEFEDYIKARYPVDYDSLKEKYPNVHVCEFYGDEQDLWDLKQAEIEQLKAKNTQLTHALVNANAEKSKWQKDYWQLVERNAEYGAMLISDPSSLEYKCYQKEKQNEWLKKQLEIQQVLLDISKPKLHKTDMGNCLHFSTTMFHEGKAECFDCGAVVNQARKVIGIKQALRGGHE